MKKLIALLLSLSTAAAFAGSNTANIQGKTSSGRTELKVGVQDISGSLESVELIIDGSTLRIPVGGNDRIHETVIRDEDNDLYVLILETEDAIFRLWMVPGSEKVLRKENGIFSSRFAAVIEATDPRKSGKWTLTPQITIGCSLHWEI